MRIHSAPPVEITDRFWMLGSLPYPLYLHRGQHAHTLFEGGTGATGPVLRQQIDALGISTGSVTQAVITHAHPDHVMAIPVFRELFPRVAILASAAAARTLSAEKAISFFGKLDDLLTTSLIQEGLATEQSRQPAPAAALFAVDRVVAEGDRIEVDDGCAFETLATPGHSDCSLSFLEPQRRVLIISDATGYYLPDQEHWWPNYFFDYSSYVQSIRRLSDLHAEILCLSHNAVICGAADVADYFRRALAATEEYHERIVREAQAGQSVRQIAEALGNEAYQRTPLLPVDFFQKNCGLLVKQSLKHAGLSAE
jgi:glyoxylase-like metal-dependent hydrolase (beta-lactamase superfamily II)